MLTPDTQRIDLTEAETRAIVDRGISQGRRSLAVRRGVTGVAALAVVAALGIGAVNLFAPNGAPVAPGNGPTQAPSAPVKPVESIKPTEAPTPVKVSGDAVFAVAKTLLPSDLTLTEHADSKLDATRFLATDSEGSVNAVVAVWGDVAPEPCEAPACVSTAVPGGTVQSVDASLLGKRGITRLWTFTRATGGSVYLSLDNVEFTGDKSWHETRPTLPLTDEEAIAFVSDSAWAPLLDGATKG